MSPVTRLLMSVVIVLAVLIGGTIGYQVVANQSLLDSLYMTAITVSTVGFEEVHAMGVTGRLMTIAGRKQLDRHLRIAEPSHGINARGQDKDNLPGPDTAAHEIGRSEEHTSELQSH